MRQTILRLHRELGLTILLSSHLLHEVEQICSRIAVLNNGRMVFEGNLSSIRERAQWIRLRVGDFVSAVRMLREAQLLSDERDGNLVALGRDVGTDQVVRLLVEKGMPVFEITPDKESLENFYLELMNGKRETK
jgi:ABC-type multidrug transport system ATPase subunit